MELMVLYFIVTGVISASFMYDTKDGISMNILAIAHGLIWGWLVTPIFIGRVLRQVYNEEQEEQI